MGRAGGQSRGTTTRARRTAPSSWGTRHTQFPSLQEWGRERLDYYEHGVSLGLDSTRTVKPRVAEERGGRGDDEVGRERLHEHVRHRLLQARDGARARHAAVPARVGARDAGRGREGCVRGPRVGVHDDALA